MHFGQKDFLHIFLEVSNQLENFNLEQLTIKEFPHHLLLAFPHENILSAFTVIDMLLKSNAPFTIQRSLNAEDGSNYSVGIVFTKENYLAFNRYLQSILQS